MKKAFVTVLLIFTGLLVLNHVSQSQAAKLSDEHRAAMNKLAFLVGNWQGQAWSMMPNQPKELVSQTETVEWDLNGSILIVRGKGTQKNPDTSEEIIVHQALGILSFDTENHQYNFNSYLSDGRATRADAVFEDNGDFVWKFETPMGIRIRYKIKINKKGQWVEDGEWSRDGENWIRFFGMTLERVK